MQKQLSDDTKCAKGDNNHCQFENHIRAHHWEQNIVSLFFMRQVKVNHKNTLEKV